MNCLNSPNHKLKKEKGKGIIHIPACTDSLSKINAVKVIPYSGWQKVAGSGTSNHDKLQEQGRKFAGFMYTKVSSPFVTAFFKRYDELKKGL